MTDAIRNLDRARFECTFGRGCEGVCCRNGRPPLYAQEREQIDHVLPRVLPVLRPSARVLVQTQGYASRRLKAGQPMARVADGWCVFFNRGCVLHRLGQADGDVFRYKPWTCATFPLSLDDRGRWYVRQKGVAGEIWELDCLDPKPSTPPAARSLQAEIALVLAWTSTPEAQDPAR